MAMGRFQLNNYSAMIWLTTFSIFLLGFTQHAVAVTRAQVSPWADIDKTNSFMHCLVRQIDASAAFSVQERRDLQSIVETIMETIQYLVATHRGRTALQLQVMDMAFASSMAEILVQEGAGNAQSIRAKEDALFKDLQACFRLSYGTDNRPFINDVRKLIKMFSETTASIDTYNGVDAVEPGGLGTEGFAAGGLYTGSSVALGAGAALSTSTSTSSAGHMNSGVVGGGITTGGFYTGIYPDPGTVTTADRPLALVPYIGPSPLTATTLSPGFTAGATGVGASAAGFLTTGFYPGIYPDPGATTSSSSYPDLAATSTFAQTSTAAAATALAASTSSAATGMGYSGADSETVGFTHGGYPDPGGATSAGFGAFELHGSGFPVDFSGSSSSVVSSGGLASLLNLSAGLTSLQGLTRIHALTSNILQSFGPNGVDINSFSQILASSFAQASYSGLSSSDAKIEVLLEVIVALIQILSSANVGSVNYASTAATSQSLASSLMTVFG